MTNEVSAQSKSLSFMQRIFIGRQGIRAGWSLGLFLVVAGILTGTFFLPTKYLLEMNNVPITDTQPIPASAGELASFLGLLAASMIMARIERRPIISYGLEGIQRLTRFLQGVLSGLVALSLLIGVLNYFGLLAFEGQSLHGLDILAYAFGWGVTFFLVGLYEEYFFRGYLQATLSRGIGFWWSAFLLSILFGGSHFFNKGESPVGICSTALLGLVFCISLRYFKNLWWAIGFHASWNWAQSYVWGTSNSGRGIEGHLFSVHPQGNILWSGGSTGPEGSLLVLPLLFVIALLLWLVWKNEPVSQTVN